MLMGQEIESENTMKHLRITLLVAILLSTIMIIPTQSQPVSAQDSPVVDGFVVMQDGDPMPGVEVFLGIMSDPFEARYTCTDASGYFSFMDVPVDTPMIAAVGFEVEFGEPCANPYFLAPDGQPLLIQTFDSISGGGSYDTFTIPSGSAGMSMTFNPELWSTNGNATLNNSIIRSIRFFQRGQPRIAVRQMQFFKRYVNVMQARGLIDRETADALKNHADVLIDLFQTLS